MSWLLALLPLVPLGMTVANLAAWRPIRRPGPVPRASALVPARDEEETIEACVLTLLAEPFAEVVVYDDGSTDRTSEILASFTDPRVRVLRGGPLPPGWVGKPHACARLAEAATGELLVFVDADVRLRPGALSLIAGARQGDVLSVLPEQRIGSFGEALILPLLHLTYTSFLFLPLVGRTRDPRVLAANGQVLAVTRAAHDAIGGFSAVRAEVVDDMAFCRAAKAAGLRVDFVDGSAAAVCRMYRSGADAWAGFSKNLLEGVGSVAGLSAVVTLYAACFLLPWVLLPVAPLPALVGIGANLVQRGLLAWRFGHPPAIVLLHPVSIVAFVAIAVRSWWWSRAHTIRWRGRVYAARAVRVAR
jgi:chlorobactene glucosyltransferase